MIFKKPYILLIKYFRLIHFILGLLVIYSIYKCNVFLNFFKDYIKGNLNISGVDLQENMFNSLIFVVPILILVISILLLWLMVKKKKPFRFYLYNSLIFLIIIVILIYIYNYMGVMNQKAVDILIVRTLRDILIIIIFLQSISLLIIFIRTIGFNLKKFEFMSDLNSLELSDDDLEEFEVDFNFDSNERKRKRRKYLRFLKYSYLENKVFIYIILIIILGIIGYIFYRSFNVYNIINKEGKIISTKYYDYSVENTYLINEDTRGSIITNNTLVVVNLKIKSSIYDNIIISNYKLMIGDNSYSMTNKYDKYLKDIGNVYNADFIDNNFREYLFVFEVPNDILNNSMFLVYYDLVGSIKVKLNPIKYDKSLIEGFIGNQIIIEDSSFLINNYEIRDRFTINYDYCFKDECFKSIEYLVPSLNTNYDKNIIKINGIYNDDIMKSSYIEYTIDSNSYISSLESIDSKLKDDNIYYYEVDGRIKNSESIKLVFNTRKCKYVYSLK